MNMNFKRRLPIPKEIKEMFPITEDMAKIKAQRDQEIKDIISGKSNKFLLIIGPCSADNEDSVIDYITRLKGLQEKVKDKILMVPRIYTNKPRTTGAGYKGMLHQPDPHKSEDMLKGIISIRKLHIRALNETGFTCADEMLYPENHRHLSDLLSYVAVGARSVENQFHRLTASGLDIAVGMKNPTSGDLSVLMNSLVAAQSGHTFIYRNWEVETCGNEYAHIILRGHKNKRGQHIPNYHYEDLMHIAEMYENSHLKNPAVIIDTNHENSGKQYLEQIRIAHEIMHSRKANPIINKMVKGLMIESYIEDGSQKMDEYIYGKSYTDPCLGWEKTEKLVLELADLV